MPGIECWRRSRRGFLRAEDGSLTVLNLFLILVVMMVCGIAVDVVRHEARRARVQNTLDRAILAAADMSQKLTAAEVVYSYFEKAGLEDYYSEPHVEIGFNAKTVSGTAAGWMDTFFMNMLGVNRLRTFAAGTAEESISDIEISLVVDVSGSMEDAIQEYVCSRQRYGSCTSWKWQDTDKTKLEALQMAAGEFIDTIFGSTATARTSMSIIPYNEQVNAGATLLGQFNVSTQNTVNNCIDFYTSDFSTAAISTSSLLHRSDSFYYWSSTWPSFNYGYTASSLLTSAPVGDCMTGAAVAILPWADTATKAKAKIDGLKGGGNTSTEIGVKWGAALLDPSTRPAAKGLADLDVILPAFALRPKDYNDPDVMKVMVVMTDGANTHEYRLKPAFRDGYSDVYSYTCGTKTCYALKGPDIAEPTGSTGGRNYGDGDSNRNETIFFPSNSTLKDRFKPDWSGVSNVQNLTWAQVWQVMTINYYADLKGKAASLVSNDSYNSSKYNNEFNRNDAGAAIETMAGTKDDKMLNACSAAKNQGVIVFTIAFGLRAGVSAEDAAAQLMQSCASSPSHFYRVDGLDIITAFQSIANAIGKLRLTQ